MNILNPTMADLEKASVDAMLTTGDRQRQAVHILFITATAQMEKARELAKELERLLENGVASSRELVSLRMRNAALEEYQRRVIEAAAPIGYAIVDESVLPAFQPQTTEAPPATPKRASPFLRVVTVGSPE